MIRSVSMLGATLGLTLVGIQAADGPGIWKPVLTDSESASLLPPMPKSSPTRSPKGRRIRRAWPKFALPH